MKMIFKNFDKEKLIYRVIALAFIAAVCFVVFKNLNAIDDETSFRGVSNKPYAVYTDKKNALNNASQVVSDVINKNDALSPTNLNLAKYYEKVVDDEDRKFYAANAPVPVLFSDEVKEEEVDDGESAAFQIYEKLQNRYSIYNQMLYNLCNTNPVYFVREYHYNGWGIIGKYNPEVSSHIKGKKHTYFIQNFQNVNIYYQDGDGNFIEDDNNIKDIMSMASVYTYYHDPYDTKNFLKYAYDLFDNSYSYVASISEVYYCSGCMHYDDPDIATGSDVIDITYEKIKNSHSQQKVLPKDVPYKAGSLKRMPVNSYTVTDGNYSDYVQDIYDGSYISYNNYCPGHIDLNLYVKVMTLDSSNGLPSIDKNYGNRGVNFNKNWHGWDAFMINAARTLYYKDWEEEYGLGISFVKLVEPLTQEEINYYLSRLDPNLSANRKKVIETALRSVGKIPYYYGGKTSRFGYETNSFGTKVPADYKGRCLKGLDCSGWVNWVYGTTFNKYIIKSEGTAKLAIEGSKITRKELLPGDLIVRPGIDAHVMMFLEWADGDKMTVIHENGSVNNVSIGTFDAYYPHYRRILNT